MRRFLPILFVAAVVTGGSLAASGRGDSSITLENPQPVHYGDTVTFAWQASRNVVPWVALYCYQDGKLVGADMLAMDPTNPFGTDFHLGPSGVWTGGAADCRADLLDKTKGKFPGQVLATTEFHVEG